MKNEKGMVIGLTGPTGAGKSELTALLTKAGIPVVDTDILAREVTQPGHPCLQKLAAAFSSAILRSDGSLDRRELAARAFATPQGRATLNAITHPPVLARAQQLVEKHFAAGAACVVIDAPLLFESGGDTLCDRTVAVLAAPHTRLARIMQRDNLTEEQARVRMNAQPSEEYYTARVDEVLRNDGDLAAFRAAAGDWIARLTHEDFTYEA